MKDFYVVKYIDAYCIYFKNIGVTKLKPHEARGYVIRNGTQVVVFFMKERSEILNIHNKKKIVEGLVIPTSATIPYSAKKYPSLEKSIRLIKIRSRVMIRWLDVVHVAGMSRYICSEMYTEGILEKVEYDHIVVRDPETIRICPQPIQNHPLEKPTFYIIPKSFILSIASI